MKNKTKKPAPKKFVVPEDADLETIVEKAIAYRQQNTNEPVWLILGGYPFDIRSTSTVDSVFNEINMRDAVRSDLKFHIRTLTR